MNQYLICGVFAEHGGQCDIRPLLIRGGTHQQALDQAQLNAQNVSAGKLRWEGCVGIRLYVVQKSGVVDRAHDDFPVNQVALPAARI